MFMSVCLSVLSAAAQRGPKCVFWLVEPKLKVVESYLMWVFRTEPGVTATMLSGRSSLVPYRCTFLGSQSAAINTLIISQLKETR